MNRFQSMFDDRQKNMFFSLADRNPLLKFMLDLMLIVFLIALATMISFYLKRLNVHESNIIMTYLLSVLIIAYLIEGYSRSFISSLLGVLTFNYFFTEPYHSLTTYRSDYPVTFIFMFTAATITSTLTMKVKHEAKISNQREKRAYLLYHISQRLLHVTKETHIGVIIGEDFSKVMNTYTIIAYCKDAALLDDPIIYRSGTLVTGPWRLASHQVTTMRDCINHRISKLTKKQFYDDINMYYVPVIGQNAILGVIGFGLYDGEILTDEKRELCAIIASQMAMAIERERLNEERRSIAIQIESEQLRSNLLRAISHDLRTPLTGILGATGTLMESWPNLLESQKFELLNNIFDETKWLIHTVENILRLTQLDEGRIKMNIKKEFMEEVIAEVVSRIAKQMINHILELSIPNELVMVDMDGQLIEHVLINLLDNASKYTPAGSTVKVTVTYTESSAIVNVSDNGPGLPDTATDELFRRFYTSGLSSDQNRRGIGLGLEICKAIIEAHGGKISASNNESGGATFEFTIPLRRAGYDT